MGRTCVLPHQKRPDLYQLAATVSQYHTERMHTSCKGLVGATVLPQIAATFFHIIIRQMEAVSLSSVGHVICMQTVDNFNASRLLLLAQGAFNCLNCSWQVCGGHGSPCDVLCGGGGCGKCGGMVSCQDGSVTLAADAYDLTQRADALLRNKMKADEEAAAEVIRSIQMAIVSLEWNSLY